MPFLAQALTAAIGAIAGFLAKLFAVRLAIRVAAVAAIGALGAGLMATFNGIVAPLAAAAFSTSYGQLLGLVFPPVAGTAIAGVTLCWIACTTYKLQVRAIEKTAGI